MKFIFAFLSFFSIACQAQNSSLFQNDDHNKFSGLNEVTDKRLQYPGFLAHSYLNINFGYINYPFSNSNLERGYRSTSVRIPHPAVRIVFGHQFKKKLSAQIAYMRPVNWVKYHNINGNHRRHSVWMNILGLTLKYDIPFSNKFSFSAEGGMAIVTRKGFKISNSTVVKDAVKAHLLFGGGLNYHLNNNWELTAGALYSPAHSKSKQPYTVFYSAGFRYNMMPLPAEKIKQSQEGYIFPKHLLQLGFSSNQPGYTVNDFARDIYIFWGGDVYVQKGISIAYQKNVFHTTKVFSLDIGTSFSDWTARKINGTREKFYTLSAFPVLRFTVLRTQPLDLYFNYSVAGPTYISRIRINEKNTGAHFTFQDFMGMGIFAGKKRNVNAELKITHYSNGNIFTHNPGVTIPLTFSAGYTF